jgi:hypothetical protein
MQLFLSILFIVIAAICKAMADTLDQHFDTSIFRDKPRRTWDPNVIQKTNASVFGYPLDAWHVINSIQLCSWFALMVVYRPVLPDWWMDYGAGGTVFIIAFNLFYNKIFR